MTSEANDLADRATAYLLEVTDSVPTGANASNDA